MKHVERLGNEFAQNWTKPRLSEAEQAALSHAYQTGFQKAREMAAGMIESFNNPKFNGVPLLIRAIAEARVEDSEEEIAP